MGGLEGGAMSGPPVKHNRFQQAAMPQRSKQTSSRTVLPKRGRGELTGQTLSRAPMPLVLAVAPNGAVTGAIPLKLTEAQVGQAFVSPIAAQCLKAVQSRKLVLLCVQPIP